MFMRTTNIHITLLNHNTCAQQLYIAQQRSVAPCPAVRCCVVLRCAFVRTYSSTRYDAKYQVPGTVMYVHVGYSFFFLQLRVIFSRSPSMPPPPPANCPRTADQNVTSPTSTQHSAHHRATSSAQADALGIINSLVAPSHGHLLSAPFTYTCLGCIILSASGVSRLQKGALVY